MHTLQQELKSHFLNFFLLPGTDYSAPCCINGNIYCPPLRRDPCPTQIKQLWSFEIRFFTTVPAHPHTDLWFCLWSCENRQHRSDQLAKKDELQIYWSSQLFISGHGATCSPAAGADTPALPCLQTNPQELCPGTCLHLHQAGKHTDHNSIINTAPKLVTSASITFYLLAADLLRSWATCILDKIQWGLLTPSWKLAVSWRK